MMKKLTNGIPSSWILCNVGEVSVDSISGSGFPKEHQGFKFGTYPFAKVGDISRRFRAGHKKIRDADHYIDDEVRQRLNAKIFPKGTIVFAKIGEALRNNYRIICDREMLFDNNVMGIVPDTRLVNESYLYYLLLTKDFGEFAVATAVPSVRRGDIEAIEVPLPPLNEQKRIVNKIEELFSELDNGIKGLKTAREQLKVYRQSILKYAFDSKLNDKYQWKEASFGQLTSLVTSGSRDWAKYYSDTGELFIRAQNLKYDELDLTEKAYVRLPTKTEGTRTLVQKNDLLITITGANVTKSALIEKDLGTAYVSQHVALCRPIEGVYPKFLYWFIVAEAAGRKQLNKAAYGAGKPGLNLDNIKSVQISIPSYQEQVAVVEAIEDKLFVSKQLEQDINIAIFNCEALRQSIFKKAFTGKLVPQDTNDEPATVLLERIRAEKEILSTNGRIKHLKAMESDNVNNEVYLVKDATV